jgi:cytochrome c-type biogenesis protein CcmF
VIFGWIFLAAGLILGSRWAYDVLGWGGYWGWDSVEVAALIPFLLSTAYLHAAIGFSRTGGFRIWASILNFVVYVSVVFAMFVTRSGLVSSVHSFSISALSKYLTAYLIAGILLTVFILILRKNQIRTNPEKARLSGIQSVLTRESFFTIEIILLIGISFLCLWGILLPNMSKIFSNTEITVGADYYIHATGPLFGLLILFMGFVPLTSWGKSISRKRWMLLILFGIVAAAGVFVYSISHQIQNIRLLCILWLLGISILIIFYEFISFIISTFHKEKNDLSRSSLRNSRFLLSHLIHMGIIFMAFGIIGIEFLQKEQQIILTSGEKTDFAQYTLTLQQIRQFDNEEGETLEAEIQVESGNHVLGLIKPQRKYYTSYNQDTTVPGILSSLSGDLYIIMNADSIDSEEERKFTIFLNPWINWLWIGGIIVCIGGVFLWLGSMKQKK